MKRKKIYACFNVRKGGVFPATLQFWFCWSINEGVRESGNQKLEGHKVNVQ